MTSFLTSEQILASLIANGVGLSAALFMRTAPPRIVLFVCLFSMLAILMPWTSVAESQFANFARVDVFPTGESGNPTLINSRDVDNEQRSSTLNSLWLSIGAFWALTTVARSFLTRRRWRAKSFPDNSLKRYVNPGLANTMRRVCIRRLPESSAVFSTGVFRSEVWIGEKIRDDALLETAINHELCHIASKDQLILFVVVVVERALWWNPLIWVLGQQARRHMEYACDCRCQSLLGDSKYRKSLAELFLKHQAKVTALAVPLGSGSGIIDRMERIGMTYSLKMTHLLALVVGVVLTAAASSNLASQETEDRPSLLECHELLPENVQYDLSITSDIDTRAENRNTVRMMLTDSTKPGVEELPKEAGAFLKCLQKVIGVGDDEGWPEV